MSEKPKPTTGEADRKLGKMRIPNDTLWNAKPTPTTGEWTAEGTWLVSPDGTSFETSCRTVSIALSKAINAALTAERDKMERLEWQLATKRGQLQKAENELEVSRAEIEAEREQVESWQVRCDRRESQLSALQASIDSHNEDTGLNCYRVPTDTTALDAAIAAAQKPLVDAIEKALTMQIGSPRDVLKDSLAKVKEGK